MPPQVSVVVPTHNRSQLLALTLRSILWQEDVDFEVIVVDDGSTDDTGVVVAGFEDDRLRLVRHDLPRGVSTARNRGIAEATGSWIAFCDDDDLWAPDKLEQQLAAARDSGTVWICAGAVNITSGLRIVGGGEPPDGDEILRRLPEINVVPGGCSGVLVERRVLSEVGGFDPSLSPMADWDLWLRLARYGAPAVAVRPLVAYRVHAANMSLDIDQMEAEFALLAEREPRASAGLFYRYLGWWCLRVSRRRMALRYFVRAAQQRDPRVQFRRSLLDVAYLVREVFAEIGRRVAPRPPSRGARTSPEQEARWAEARLWLSRLQNG
jgi:glycosyltransferase involved in cell wall biosynthesis